MFRGLRRAFSSLPRVQQLYCSDRHLHTTSPTPSFTFASAVSNHGNFYKAIRECVHIIEEQLPVKDIHLCQLLVSTKHVSMMAHAPQCLVDSLNHTLCSDVGLHTVPVIIGGALQSVCGSGGPIHVESTPGVSVLAASLPGVELMPFHVNDASLPPFTEQQWSNLLHNQSKTGSSKSHGTNTSSSDGGGSSTADGCAAIVFSAPHFVEVESFLQRLSSAIPGIPVVGGVTERDAWIDTENEYGALFCGTDVYCNGAVGVVMRGPLVLQHILQPAARPAGKVMTVTQSAGNVILALDNRPVKDSFVELLHSLPKADQRKELLLGIDDSSSAEPAAAEPGRGSRRFVARSMSLSPAQDGRPVLLVAAHQIPVGARVQLLIRDFDLNYKQQEQALTNLAENLPLSSMSRPEQMALLSYCCVALPHSEGPIAAEVLPQVPFGGGRMQGEFAGAANTGSLSREAEATGGSSETSGQTAKLHSYAASFALLHHRDMLSETE